MSAPGWVPDLGGAWSRRGVSALGGGLPPGGGIPACTEAESPTPVNRMTDRCKNITFAICCGR